MPYNHITKLQYQGGNIAILASAGYKSHEWATFLQWKTAGFKVKKGSKASYIRTFIDGTKTVKDKKNGQE